MLWPILQKKDSATTMSSAWRRWLFDLDARLKSGELNPSDVKMLDFIRLKNLADPQNVLNTIANEDLVNDKPQRATRILRTQFYEHPLYRLYLKELQQRALKAQQAQQVGIEPAVEEEGGETESKEEKKTLDDRNKLYSGSRTIASQLQTQLPVTALQQLVASFHNDCEVLTDEGRRCGLGTATSVGTNSGFIFSYPGVSRLPSSSSSSSPTSSSTSAGVEELNCSAQCVGPELCGNWLAQLVLHRPRMIEFHFNNLFASLMPFFSKPSKLSVQSDSLSSLSKMVSPPSAFASSSSSDEKILRSDVWAVKIMVVLYDENSGTTAPATSATVWEVERRQPVGGIDSEDDEKDDIDFRKFVAAGCRALNSGQRMELIVELILPPYEWPKLVAANNRSYGEFTVSFPEFISKTNSNSSVGSNSATVGEYFVQANQWKFAHHNNPFGKQGWRLTASLLIRH